MTGPEISWFAALCDDDHLQLGVTDPSLSSSWRHCRSIVEAAERAGYDNVLLPSGYALGIDAVAFASGIAAVTERIRLLVAVRCGEVWVPQLARQLATLDEMLDGRLTINIISSELPGESLPGESMPSSARYQRTLETMRVLRTLLDGEPVDVQGDFIRLKLDPPRVRTTSGRCSLMYFGGLSDDARAVAAEAADVYLMWPETLAGARHLLADMRLRARAHDRVLRFGFRVHVIVRETEAAARAAAAHLMAAVDDADGARLRARSLDSASVGVRRQAELRDAADGDGFIEDHLWTGIGRARSGCGAAIVGDPDQVLRTIQQYRDLGIDAFILSGYPHRDECDRFADLVLSHLPHGPLV